MCARWVHMELFLHTLRFLQRYLLINMTTCVVHSGLLMQWWNNSQRKNSLEKFHPTLKWFLCSLAQVWAADLSSTRDSQSSLPFSLNPHMDPAHLIYSHLLMSNSCSLEQHGITAIAALLPFMCPFFFSAILRVVPNITSLACPNTVCNSAFLSLVYLWSGHWIHRAWIYIAGGCGWRQLS